MRLYLLQLGHFGPVGPRYIPIPGYLIRADDGTNILVDTGWPRLDGRGGARAGGAELLATFPDGAMQAPWARFAGSSATCGPPRRIWSSPAWPARAGPGGHRLPGVHALRLGPRRQPRPLPDRRIPGAAAAPPRRGARPARLRLFGAPWDSPALRYRLLDGDTELLPGITLVESGGHVPGHQSVLVRLPETGPGAAGGGRDLGRQPARPPGARWRVAHGPGRRAGERPETDRPRRARGRAAARLLARRGAVAHPAGQSPDFYASAPAAPARRPAGRGAPIQRASDHAPSRNRLASSWGRRRTQHSAAWPFNPVRPCGRRGWPRPVGSRQHRGGGATRPRRASLEGHRRGPPSPTSRPGRRALGGVSQRGALPRRAVLVAKCRQRLRGEVRPAPAWG